MDIKHNLGAVTFFRKLLASSVTILFSLVTLGTATFAWLTLSNTNILEGFNLTVTTGKHVQISLDGINYSYELNNAQILAAIGNQLDLRDVTSSDGFNFFTGGPEGGEEAIPNQDYVSLPIYFRTESLILSSVFLVNNESEGLTFDNTEDVTGTFFVSKGVSWKADTTFVYDNQGTTIHPNEILNHYASDSIRISFTEQAINEEQNNGLISLIYDPTENEERGFGKTYGALSYWNAKHLPSVAPPEIIPDTLYQLTKFESERPLDDTSKIVSLVKANNQNVFYVGKTVMNIWLEGWDADCFNAILQDQIKIQLVFRGASF